MNEALAKSFDFSVRIMELMRFLEEEQKNYPLKEQLLKAGAQIGIAMRYTKMPGLSKTDAFHTALRSVLECEYLLELMVETGYITELQSVPLLEDCNQLKDLLDKAGRKTKNNV